MSEPAGVGLLHPSLGRLALYLRAARPALERDLRAGGQVLPTDVAELWDELDRVAAAFAERGGTFCGTSGTPRLPDGAGSLTLPAMSTSQAAELLGVNERAVRARLARGSLAGHKDRGAWRVSAAAVHAEAAAARHSTEGAR